MKYDDFNIVELSEVSKYVTEKISGLILNKNNYISTTNMIPNKGGITTDVVVPEQNVNKFMISDILISNIRPYFKKIWYANFSGGASTDVLIIRANSKIKSKYLYYNLMSDNFFDYSMKGSKGTKMPRGDKEHIMKYPIPIVSLVNQQAIINILSSLDNKIELNNKINANLEDLAQTLYKHWFVDFEFPNEEGLPYKSSGGKLIESEIGMIPAKWETEKLGKGKLSKLISSGIEAFKSSKIYLATAYVTNTNITNHLTKISFDDKPSRANMQPKENTLWFAKMKNSRKLIRVGKKSTDLISKYIFSTGFAGLLVKDYLNYVWSFLLSNNFNETKDNMASGTTQEAINNSTIQKIKLLVPSHEVLTKFENATNDLFEKIELNNKENNKLELIRDLLLPKLMNGEIRVPIKE